MKKSAHIFYLVIVGLLCCLAPRAFAQPQYDFVPAQNLSVIYTGEWEVEKGFFISASYSYPGKAFASPRKIDFLVYNVGEPDVYKDIKSITLTYGSQTFTGKPLYRADEKDEQFYTELLLLEVPISVAKGIVHNGGMIISTSPDVVNKRVTGSNFVPFRDLLTSIAVLSSPPKAQSRKVPTPRKDLSNGLPITEGFD